MRHFHRRSMPPGRSARDRGRSLLPDTRLVPSRTPRARTFAARSGTVQISARAEGGHYTFVEAVTDQMGESRLDRNVKRFFVLVHRDRRRIAAH